MNRIFVTTLARLCMATGALILPIGVFSKAAVGYEMPHVQVAKDWTRFSPADRASCLSSTGIYGAYTDLLRCLEIKRDPPQRPKQPSTTGKGGSP